MQYNFWVDMLGGMKIYVSVSEIKMGNLYMKKKMSNARKKYPQAVCAAFTKTHAVRIEIIPESNHLKNIDRMKQDM